MIKTHNSTLKDDLPLNNDFLFYLSNKDLIIDFFLLSRSSRIYSINLSLVERVSGPTKKSRGNLEMGRGVDKVLYSFCKIKCTL